MLHVFTEGDKARKRRDKRSRTADVHAHKKLSVVLRELRQQNSRGNVADDLARHHAEKKALKGESSLTGEIFETILDSVDTDKIMDAVLDSVLGKNK